MTFISLFAGIGGIDLGLERAGHTCVGQVENDPYCIKVLEKHWPDTWRYDDITTLKPEEIPKADLWTAGFPCQDISNAGKREGIRGQRSGLFFDLMRLVRQVRPRYILLENVAALLHTGMDAVLGELSESGYDAEWDVISAASVGAPHLRERVFIVGYTNSQREGAFPGIRKGEVTESGGSGQMADTRSLRCLQYNSLQKGQQYRAGGDALGQPNAYGTLSTDVPDTNRKRLEKREGQNARRTRAIGGSQPQRKDWWSTEPDVGRVAHGVPSRVDRLRGLGNAVVPQVAEWVGRRIVEHASPHK